MSQRNVQVLRRCSELLNVGDWDSLLELYDPDVDVEFRDVHTPADVPEVLHGREGIRRVAARWTEPYDEYGAEVYQFVDADPWVICDTRWHVQGRESSKPTAVRFADAYEVKDGRIVRVIVGYRDVETALTELGATAA